MGKYCSSDKNGLKKGPWTAEEDEKLVDYIRKHGHGRWRTLPKNAGLQRCGKSCRLRWTNYLRPDIKRGKFTNEEEDTIIQLHCVLGNKWSAIAARLPGRTDNEIKNYWNTSIKKKLLRMGIDPVTHKPRLDLIHLLTSMNSSLFKSSDDQLNLPRIGPTLSPTILSLAASILSAQNQLNGPQVQDQFPCPERSQAHDQAQYFSGSRDEAQPMDAYLGQLSSNPPNFSYQNCNLVQDFGNYVTENGCQAIMNTPLENLANLNFGSLLSAVSSTDARPLFSSSSSSTSATCLNASHNDDEKESYCFSNMLMQFGVPNKLDIASNGFM